MTIQAIRKRIIAAVASAGFVALLICFSFSPGIASADQVTNRSIQLSDYEPTVVSTHTISFTVPTTNNISSMSFRYCSNSPSFNDSCTAPAGLDASATAIASQSGNTGFSIDPANTVANRIVITRPLAAGLTVPSSYGFSNITNPSAGGTTTYVRIATYPTVDATGPPQDTGSVAFVTTESPPFNVTAFVPPFIRICVGITVAPDCSSATGDFIDLGILSSTKANYAQSQYSAAANSPTGYIVYSLGTTMTSGNNIIPAINSPAPSFPGTGQFGINLRANLIPAIGQDPIGLGVGAPEPNYNTPNQFLFVPGDAISYSNSPTNYNRMTVSYLVNVNSSQPPGVYATTLTYLAIGQF